MNIKRLLKECRQYLRLLENYHPPEEVRIARVKEFLQKVVAFEYTQIKSFEASQQDVFSTLCRDIVRQSTTFLSTPKPSINDAKNLLYLILEMEHYVEETTHQVWVIGRKVSFLEKLNIRRIFKKVLHSAYDPKSKRPVRGTKIMVKIAGSLATGASDWKAIEGNVPKPSDYSLPREYRKATQSFYRELDPELAVPQKLKAKMSDVDILIVNEIIFISIDPFFAETTWSFRLGEKYQTGTGNSPIIQALFEKLIGAKIGGIRSRWVNFMVLRDERGYATYMRQRQREVAKLSAKIGRKISVQDVLILDEPVL